MYVAPTELLHDARTGQEMTFDEWARLGAAVGEAYHDPHPVRFGRQLVLEYIRSGVFSVVSSTLDLEATAPAPLTM
jgi:hypothetical protein